jgi:diaminopimelate decarboxylase
VSKAPDLHALVAQHGTPLPELQVGDLVVGRMMAAYTAASATDCNFIPRARVVAINAHAQARHAD